MLRVHENSCTRLIHLRKKNLNLQISLHKPFYTLKEKKKATTNTVFLISNTVVLSLYIHNTAFNP